MPCNGFPCQASSSLKSYRSGGEPSSFGHTTAPPINLLAAFGHFQYDACVPGSLHRAGAVGAGTLQVVLAEEDATIRLCAGPNISFSKPSSRLAYMYTSHRYMLCRGRPRGISGQLSYTQIRIPLLNWTGARSLHTGSHKSDRVLAAASPSGNAPKNRPLTCQDHCGTEDLAPKTPLGRNHQNIHAVAQRET